MKRFCILSQKIPTMGISVYPPILLLHLTFPWHLRAEQHHQPASLLASLLLGRVHLLKHCFPPWKPSSSSAFLGLRDRGHEEASGLSFQPTQLREGPLLTPSLGCKVFLLGLICEKSPPWSNAHLKWYMRREGQSTLRHCSLLSPSISLLTLSPVPRESFLPWGVTAQHPLSPPRVLWTFGCFFATHCSAQEQRLPRHLFCSSCCCDREALHTPSSPGWFLSLLPVAATAGSSWGNSRETTYAGILKVMAFFRLLPQGLTEK